MSLVKEVITVLPAPEGYDIDFVNPTRDWPVIYQTYWVYGVGTLLALFFLTQNLYVKFYINRRMDDETCESVSPLLLRSLEYPRLTRLG